MKAHTFCLIGLFFVCSSCTTIPVYKNTSRAHPVKTPILNDLKSPWAMAFISEHDVLITEKEGDLLRANLTSGERTVVTGLPDDRVTEFHTKMRGENSGLFDVVLHPDFANNRYVYLSYSARKNNGYTTKVIRAQLTKSTLTNVEPILIATPFTENEFHHYGGGLEFGSDGKLYVTIGERLFSEANQPELPIAQNLEDRRGKIYRLNDDGSIPTDNPVFDDDAVPGLYATGIRAAQALTLNSTTGELWFTEHGTHQGDELNRLRAGANYGWPVKTTGKYRDESYQPPGLSGTTFTAPEWFWLQTVAPTGLTFYTGTQFPEWQNDLLVAGLSRGSLWRVGFNRGTIESVEELFVHDRARTRNVVVSPKGELYILTDTLFTVTNEGKFTFTGVPSGSLIRIDNKALP
ncbi:MAG: PQQ-dependent sugar dehydrogenase [Gammaproteobacteria bacterium]